MKISLFPKKGERRREGDEKEEEKEEQVKEKVCRTFSRLACNSQLQVLRSSCRHSLNVPAVGRKMDKGTESTERKVCMAPH